MVIERTNDNQIVIALSSGIDSFGLQRVIDYIKYFETTGKSKATQADADALAEEVNSTWREQNRKRFLS